MPEVVNKFGPVDRCYMPMDQMREDRNRGFCIINFKNAESATRAIQEGEVSVGFASLVVSQSYQQNRRDRDGGNRRDFDILKRR